MLHRSKICSYQIHATTNCSNIQIVWIVVFEQNWDDQWDENCRNIGETGWRINIVDDILFNKRFSILSKKDELVGAASENGVSLLPLSLITVIFWKYYLVPHFCEKRYPYNLSSGSYLWGGGSLLSVPKMIKPLKTITLKFSMAQFVRDNTDENSVYHSP